MLLNLHEVVIVLFKYQLNVDEIPDTAWLRCSHGSFLDSILPCLGLKSLLGSYSHTCVDDLCSYTHMCVIYK